MRRQLLAIAGVTITTLVLASTSLASPPRLTGTDGPGYTITLTSGGKKVMKLKAGSYTFAISDRSPKHSYGLDGPNGFAKDFTSVSYKGSKTFTVKLKPGSYKFYCSAHESSMFGRFKVS